MSDVEETEEGGGSGKGLLVVGLVLGLGLGGGAAWFYLSGDDAMSEATDMEPALPPMEVMVEGVRLPVFDNRGRYSGTIKIRVAVMVNPGEDFALAQGFVSAMKHDFLMALSELEAPKGENQSVHSPDEISAVLKPVAQSVLGDIKVHDVLINDMEFHSRS